MSTTTQKHDQLLHFVLIPLMAPGHVLPTVDLARLLARRPNVKVTIMTTPLNAVRVQASIDREIAQFGSPITFQHFRFPNSEAGLPEGCESLDTLPSVDLLLNFTKALCMLQEPVEELFENLYNNSQVYENVSESESLVVPGLPHRIVFKKSQLPDWFTVDRGQDMSVFHEKKRKAEEEAYGVIVNSFEELEEECVKEYKRVTGRKIWCIGPVSLSNKDDLDKSQRGKPDSKEEEGHQYLKCWLDSWPARSVIYVCLGSLNRVAPEQLMELGLGLEVTMRPFIWVLRGAYKSEEMEKLMKEDGLEERVKGRGLIMRGWVPQVMILSHKAIGSFLTHCGWNSTLEGICSGVPLITFPLFADQFYNEKVVVQLLEIGARVGVENSVHHGEEGRCEVQVKREKVKEAIEKVMGEEEDEESESIRERARKYAETAKKAMEKGGSSWLNLSQFIEDIRQTGHA